MFAAAPYSGGGRLDRWPQQEADERVARERATAGRYGLVDAYEHRRHVVRQAAAIVPGIADSDLADAADLALSEVERLAHLVRRSVLSTSSGEVLTKWVEPLTVKAVEDLSRCAVRPRGLVERLCAGVVGVGCPVAPVGVRAASTTAFISLLLRLSTEASALRRPVRR
ncbi:hypothetical protein GCM10029964_092670 [Kibdelosporangium lantanae]